MVENHKKPKNFGDYLAGIAKILNVDFLDYSNRAELSSRIAEISSKKQRGEMPWLKYSGQKFYSNIIKDVPEGDMGRLIKALYDFSEDGSQDIRVHFCYAQLQKNALPKIYTLETIGVAWFVDKEHVQADGDKICLCWPKVAEFQPKYDDELIMSCIKKFGCNASVNSKKTCPYERLEQVKNILSLTSIEEINYGTVQKLSVSDFRKKGYDIDARALSGFKRRLRTAKA
jgi:hypothetical protein